jgi:biopolymer transport protein ExbB
MLTLPVLLSNGGPVLWLLLLVSAVAVAVFIERFLHCHRAQINSTEFLNGVRTVLKRNNVIEALSICDATPGPVARLVKTAILNRDHGRERVREALEEAGLAEVPRLEEKLDLLATIAQLAPLLGLLGTVLGFIQTFGRMQAAGLTAHIGQLSAGVWQALVLRGGGPGRGDSRRTPATTTWSAASTP